MPIECSCYPSLTSYSDSNSVLNCSAQCIFNRSQSCGGTEAYMVVPIISTDPRKSNSYLIQASINNQSIQSLNVQKVSVNFTKLTSFVNILRSSLDASLFSDMSNITNITYQKCANYCSSVNQSYGLMTNTYIIECLIR